MTKKLLYAAVLAGIYPAASFGQDKLEEIIVTSSRIETPIRQVGTSVSVINKEALELQGTTQIADVLRRQVGISASNSGGFGKLTSVRIRGEESFRTLMMLDGVELSDPSSPQVAPQPQHLTNSGDLERIEILRGPQGLMYGADAGGVINMFTQSAQKGLHGALSAESGRYGTRSVKSHLSASNGRFDGFVSASNFQTDGFNARIIDQENEADGYENNTLHGKFGANLSEHTRLQLVVRDISGETEYDCTITNNCVSHYEQSTARASFQYNTASSKSTFGASQTEVERENFDDGVRSFATKGDTQKLDYVGSFKLNNMLTLAAGSDFKTETLEAESGEDNSRDQLGVFSEIQLHIEDAFFWTAGLRYDDNEDFGEHLSLRFTSAYVYNLDKAHTLKFRTSLGTGFRAPSLSELAYNKSAYAAPPASDTTLTEENSQGLDVGLDYFWGDAGSVEMTFFYQEVENEIGFDLVSYSGYLQDSGVSQSRGLEVALNMPITDNLIFVGNLTHNKTLTTEDTQRTRRPENQANLGFNCYLMNDSLVVNLNYRVQKDSLNLISVDSQGNTVRDYLDDYEVLDVSAQYDIKPWLKVFARVENALNEEYTELQGYNSSAAAAYAGLRFSF